MMNKNESGLVTLGVLIFVLLIVTIVSIVMYIHQKKRLESCPTSKTCPTSTGASCLIPTGQYTIQVDAPNGPYIYGLTNTSNTVTDLGLYLYVGDGTNLPPDSAINNDTWDVTCMNTNTGGTVVLISAVNTIDSGNVSYFSNTPTSQMQVNGANVIAAKMTDGQTDPTYATLFNVSGDKFDGNFTLEFFGNTLLVNTQPKETALTSPNTDIIYLNTAPPSGYTSVLSFTRVVS